MKFKLFLLSSLLVLAMALGANYFFVKTADKELATNLKDNVIKAASLFNHINRADSFARLDEAENLAGKKAFLEVFDMNAYFENPEEISRLIRIELDIINKYDDDSDIIFVTNLEGIVVAKNLDQSMRGMALNSVPSISRAIDGKSSEDIMEIKKRFYRTTTVPIRKDCQIVGTMTFGNKFDSEMAEADFMMLNHENNSDSIKKPLYFAYIDLKAKNLIASNMPTEIHSALRTVINSNDNFSSTFFEDGKKTHSFSTTMSDGNYFISLTKYQRNSDKEIFFVVAGSVDDALSIFKNKKEKFILFSILIALLGLVAVFILEEKFMAPINRFMEGMLEVISGNRDFRFSSDANDLEGNLNQNANYMISVLLNEENIDKPDEEDKIGDE